MFLLQGLFSYHRILPSSIVGLFSYSSSWDGGGFELLGLFSIGPIFWPKGISKLGNPGENDGRGDLTCGALFNV